jgi:organic radical activating enzyme
MYSLPYSEFYITNVCNLNCPNCNRFNNYAFTGHQNWNDHADLYQQWSKIINLKEIGILGGEPMLNPSFMDWVKGILELWPTAEKISIITNGTQLDRWSELYQMLVDFPQLKLDVSFHGVAQKEVVMADLTTFLKGPIKVLTTYQEEKHWNKYWKQSYENIKDPSWPNCNTPQDFPTLPQHIQDECETQHHFSLDIFKEEVYRQDWIEDANGVLVKISMANEFVPSTVIFDPELQNLRLHNSNPELALSNCFSKQCHTFIAGKLYKCPTVGILPTFIEQFPVEISTSDKQLLNSYIPASANMEPAELFEFINSLNRVDVIDQCKFCPESGQNIRFEAGPKKIKLHKIS